MISQQVRSCVEVNARCNQETEIASPGQIDDDLSPAVSDVADEIDARRTGMERIRDGLKGVRWLMTILWYQWRRQ